MQIILIVENLAKSRKSWIVVWLMSSCGIYRSICGSYMPRRSLSPPRPPINQAVGQFSNYLFQWHWSLRINFLLYIYTHHFPYNFIKSVTYLLSKKVSPILSLGLFFSPYYIFRMLNEKNYILNIFLKYNM